MTYHILNGDALYDRFIATKIAGQVIIDRECLIEGDVSGDTLADFWDVRSGFIEASYQETRTGYFQRVVSEFDKLIAAPDQSEVNLWFGYDLFCQVNMWFVLSLLSTQSKAFSAFVVYPSHLNEDAIWDDFGRATVADLTACAANRVSFSDVDLQLGNELWNAFKTNDLTRLAQLADTNSPCFPYLKTVCRAHIDRFNAHGTGRPQRVVNQLIARGLTSFSDVFRAFSQQEGVYGFGDSQVKPLYDKAISG